MEYHAKFNSRNVDILLKKGYKVTFLASSVRFTRNNQIVILTK